jgi:hypothetical protein
MRHVVDEIELGAARKGDCQRRPLSFTSNSIESVPAVWPGIGTIVTLRPPSVMSWRSVTAMSRLGLPFGNWLKDFSIVSQSPAPMTIRDP